MGLLPRLPRLADLGMSLDDTLRDLSFAKGLAKKQPFQVLVQVTNRCNMTCSFCDFWPNPAPKKEELTTRDFERLSDELAELGTFLVSIEGGEPFARSDLADIVGAFAKHHLPVLFTNGWYLTPESAKELWGKGLAHANVSIDYATAARHDAKRGQPGATERAWRSIDTFLETSPHGGKQVHVMTVFMKDNQDEMDRLFAQSKEHGVSHQVTLLSLGGTRRGQGGTDGLPDADAAKRLAKLVARTPHVRFFRAYFDDVAAFVAGKSFTGCGAGRDTFNIDHVGNVSPCIEKIGENVGNVKTEPMKALYEKLLVANQKLATCNDCFTACRGFSHELGAGRSAQNLIDLGTRMRRR